MTYLPAASKVTATGSPGWWCWTACAPPHALPPKLTGGPPVLTSSVSRNRFGKSLFTDQELPLPTTATRVPSRDTARSIGPTALATTLEAMAKPPAVLVVRVVLLFAAGSVVPSSDI